MGILISNNGTMTLPCVLFIVGIPLLAIGQYRFNKEGIISSSAGDGGDGGSGSGSGSGSGTGSTTTTNTIFALLSFREKNFQWNTGIMFVVLAVLLVISETKIFNDCYFKLKMLLQGGDSSSDSATTRRRTNDEDDIETEIMSTYYTHEEIVKQIKTIIKDNNKNNNIANNSSTSNYKCRNLNRDDGSDVILKRNLKKIICCLNALAFKIDTIHKNKKKNTSNDNNDKNDNNVFLSSQEASYIALQAFNDKDQIISSAFSLLALTAKCRPVRQRHHHHHSSSLKSSSKSSSSTPTPTSLESEQSDINYDLKLPIQIMKSSLERTKKGIRMKDTNNNNTTTDNTIDQKEEEKEEKEQLAAEVQRKGCIYLGALADGDTNLAGIIVQSGGLARIIESIDWFRYHLHVINWALWAIFNLCFDHMGNKLEFFRCNGTIKICCAMKNVLKLEEKDMSTGSSDDAKCLRKEDCDDDDSDEESGGILEVARHGVAILFDFLRYDSTSETNSGNNNGQPTLDFMQVRRVALNAGLHEVIILAMKRCSKNTQVMMMGNQILVATGYNGKIPSFQGSIVPVPRK